MTTKQEARGGAEMSQSYRDFERDVFDRLASELKGNKAPPDGIYRKVTYTRLACHNGKIYNLGSFSTAEAAERAVEDFQLRRSASLKERIRGLFRYMGL